MCMSYQTTVKFFVLILNLFAIHAFAQESAATQSADKKAEVVIAAPNINAVKNSDVKTEAAKAQPAKKMVQDATINLQTTITGNQEQPRVLYILPWQSPQTANVDFEPLDSQQKAVFSHVEREELRRELESAGELQ